jgi:hypothetical protein
MSAAPEDVAADRLLPCDEQQVANYWSSIAVRVELISAP